ncbi:MAG: hypothetical protein R2710_05825 [Acidimicrobiales bacterium]
MSTSGPTPRHSRHWGPAFRAGPILPAAAFAGRVSGFDPSVRPFATQTVHEFDTEAEAQAFIAAGQSLQATCGTIVDGTTYVETQTPMTLTTVATDQYSAVLITHEGDPADNGDILMVASVRFGRTVTTVGLMTKLNDSDTVPFRSCSATCRTGPTGSLPTATESWPAVSSPSPRRG